MSRPRERGAVSVELALVTPILLMLVLGGVHLGRALGARHRLSEAVSQATRSAAIANVDNQATIATYVRTRMDAAGPGCTEIRVRSSVSTNAFGIRALEVMASCTLPAPFGERLLGAMGPSEVSASAAMPMGL
ncbi:MAG: pilus assembly protein [Deltaproteobacteria bacterium]|nr:pilus assembly protein [Deltaproteobacteria bacterium]